jgi:hypothetical protein
MEERLMVFASLAQGGLEQHGDVPIEELHQLTTVGGNTPGSSDERDLKPGSSSRSKSPMRNVMRNSLTKASPLMVPEPLLGTSYARDGSVLGSPLHGLLPTEGEAAPFIALSSSAFPFITRDKDMNDMEQIDDDF